MKSPGVRARSARNLRLPVEERLDRRRNVVQPVERRLDTMIQARQRIVPRGAGPIGQVMVGIDDRRELGFSCHDRTSLNVIGGRSAVALVEIGGDVVHRAIEHAGDDPFSRWRVDGARRVESELSGDQLVSFCGFEVVLRSYVHVLANG
jgi:hypothetical protein